MATASVTAPLPPARRLLAKLLLATLGPAVVILGGFGVWAHEESRLAVEDALGRRLGAAAAGAALLVLPEQLGAIGAGDEDTMTYARLRASLMRARQTLDVRRVMFVAKDLTGRGDSDDQIGLGAVAHELTLDTVELERAARGAPVASPLFLGRDGRPYKRAYAAIRAQPVPGEPADRPGLLAGYAVVEASADTLAPLARLRQTLIATGVVGLLLILLFGVMLARQLTEPLGRLAAAAERIGSGDLQAAVPIETRDEIGQLAARLDEMRLALRSRDERLQMMLAGIAHEVRNPLGGLQLYAGLLRESLSAARPPDAESLASVARIEREVRYLEQVVKDFLEYARRPRSELTPQPLRPLLEEVAEVVGTPGAVTVEMEGDHQVAVDRSQLRRALINLVRNAIGAAGADGRVVLAARAGAASRVVIEVRDSGPGVPAELRGKIFEPFFTTREKGTGLGLAFVREIVRDHGGEVAVDDAPEGGARFHFQLPVELPGNALG